MRRLAVQKLGLAVGAVLGVAATLAVVAVAVFVGGRDSNHSVYTLRQGDVVRDPLTATRCEATGEGGSPNFFCTRTTKGRHQFVFYKDAVLVFDLGDRTRDPLDPSYTFDWFTGSSGRPLEPPAIGETFTPLPCPMHPQTTVALEGCTESAILSTDHEINAESKVIFGLLRSRRARVTFAQGEEAWLHYRASSCTTEVSVYAGGSAQPVAYGACIAARNRTHLRELDTVKAMLSRH